MGAEVDIPTRQPCDLGVRELGQRQNMTQAMVSQPGPLAPHPVLGPTHSVTGAGGLRGGNSKPFKAPTQLSNKDFSPCPPYLVGILND